MNCLDDAQIAQLASTDVADAHADACIACRTRIAREREMAARIASLAGADISAVRRRELGAEILATAQFIPHARARRMPVIAIAIASAVAAAAAALALLVGHASQTTAAPSVAVQQESEPASISAKVVASEDPLPTDEAAPHPAPPRIDVSAGAVLSHEVGEEEDTLSLVDGTVKLDTRASRLVDVHVGPTRVRVANASVIVTARARRVISVQVVVGSARIDSPDQRVTLQRDSLWMPSASSAAQRSMAIYRDAWIALRAGRNREAMELFDRVTDPVAREDAMYWGAIAAQRLGEVDVAKKRIDAFLVEFPHSDYVEQLKSDPAP